MYVCIIYIYYNYIYVYINIYICICANPMSRRRLKRLKADGFGWFFNFHPFFFFSKTCPAETHAGNFFIISLELLKACSFEGITRWHSDKASGAFLSAQCGCSKDLNINVRKSTVYPRQRVNINIRFQTACQQQSVNINIRKSTAYHQQHVNIYIRKASAHHQQRVSINIRKPTAHHQQRVNLNNVKG